MNQITFQGTISGDGECFHWDQLPEEDLQSVLGEQQYAENLRFEQEFHEETGYPAQTTNKLYPSEIWDILGCESGKTYRFTIQVEEVVE